MSAIHVPEWVGQLLEPLPRDEPANGAGDREDTWIDGFGRETAVLLRPLPRVLIFGRRPRIVRMGLVDHRRPHGIRSEEHTSELQSLMRISYAVFCLKKKNTTLH